MQSNMLKLQEVVFPDFTGLQIYMKKVKVALLEKTIPIYGKLMADLAKAAGLEPEATVFVTVDEREVQKGTSHRRGGVHIDGNYVFDWGGGGWLNGVPGKVLTPEQHKIQYQSDKGGLIIASNYPGCDVWLGSIDGIAGQGGDCEHLRNDFPDNLTKERMIPNQAYILNSTCIHQSVPLDATVKRQLIRMTLDHTFQLPH